MKEQVTLSQLTLEQYALGELDESRKAAVDRLVSANPSIQEKIDGIRRSNEEILKKYPATVMTAQIMQKTGQEKQRRLLRLLTPAKLPAIGLAVVAVAAIMLLFAVPAIFNRTADSTIPLSDVPEQGNGAAIAMDSNPTTSATADSANASTPAAQDKGREIIILKGSNPVGLEIPHLTLFIQAGSGAEATAKPLADNSKVAAGDLIQVRYYAAEKKYGVILSIDGRGSITLHSPAVPALPPEVEPKREVFLPESFRLDDAPAYERFFFIASDNPLAVADILDSAGELVKDPVRARTEMLDLPPLYSQSSVILIKEKQ